MKTRIMYIERKDDGINGPARIGRVSFSKSRRSLYYRGQPPPVIPNGASRRSFLRFAPAKRSACGCEESLCPV